MNRTTRALLAAVVATVALTACSVTVDSRPSDQPATPADTVASDLTDDQRAALLQIVLQSSTPADRASLCAMWERDGADVVAAGMNTELDADQRVTADIVDTAFEEEC